MGRYSTVISIVPTSSSSSSSVDDANDDYLNSTVESVLSEIGETRNINGYDLTDTNSMPNLSFDNTTRTFSCSIKSGQSSFHFWADNKKIVKTTTQSVILPNITNTYYIIFDTSGTLVAVTQDAVAQDDFYAHAITGLVYWNATAQTGLAGNEMHGKLMDPRTHHYNHSTFGARYEPSGLNINGLVDRSKTYTETTSGYFWDEDIRHTVPLQSTHPFIYRLGTTGEWTATTPDNNVGFENGTGDVVFNEYNGSTWQLTQSGSLTDYIIYFFIVTPDIAGFPVKKIIGQYGYKDRNAARNAITSEKNSISLHGLPSPEFIFLYAYIVRQNGDLEDLEDGSTYIDLRLSKGGSPGDSGNASVAADVNVTTADFDKLLSVDDTNVQVALNTLNNHVHDYYVAPVSVSTITSNYECTLIIPVGCILEKIIILETNSNTTTINIGTTITGSELLSAQNILADSSTVFVFNRFFSKTVSQTIYISSLDWNSSSLDLIFQLTKLT